ncbi:MAG: aminotransferase class III-fold pyridoxal phosphate-dependent enzyme [Polyangiaceae bacterium]
MPGPRSLELRAREDVHLAPGAQGYAISSGLAVESAIGSALLDADGNTILDFIGGIGVNALGHSHPRMIGALTDQVARISVGSLTTSARVDLLEQVTAHTPPGLNRVQLYSSGAEAVESALRLAKSHTGKFEILSFWGGFHGKTLGALSLMGSPFKANLGPLVPGVHQAPYADCYRCPFGLKYPSCGLHCADFVRKQAKVSGGALAAVIIEPVQGTAGNIKPPAEFMSAMHSIAREHDALFIADEMITGFGRTGSYWGIDDSHVVPDIMTVGKGFGGGFPLSGLITTNHLSQAAPWSNASGSSSSYGGNPLAAAAGAAALRAIDEERLVENSRIVGAYMLRELEAFCDRYPFVGLVDGAGLLIRIELVKDKKSKVPLPPAVMKRIFQECLRRGLLTMAYSASFRLQPALTIDRATARNGLDILRDVFDWVRDTRLWE